MKDVHLLPVPRPEDTKEVKCIGLTNLPDGLWWMGQKTDGSHETVKLCRADIPQEVSA